MKQLCELEVEAEVKKEDLGNLIRKEINKFIKRIEKKYPELPLKDIESVGIIENGELQLKVPVDIQHFKVVELIGWLKWFRK